VPALGEKSPGLPASSPGPPKAGESQSAEWPYRDIDPRTGRLRPISDEELRARYEQYKRELAEIDAADDTPEEVYDEVMRNIEASRSLEGEASGVPSSTTGPSMAGDCQSGERPQADVGLRAGQWWRQISAEEWRARHEEYKRRIAELDAEDDTPEEVYDEIERHIDEERRRQGRPPAFEGCD
jgi:hypothetical protein